MEENYILIFDNNKLLIYYLAIGSTIESQNHRIFWVGSGLERSFSPTSPAETR